MKNRYNEWHYGAACSCVPWYDEKNVYISIDEYDPGSAISHPRRHRGFLIPKTPENEYRLDEFFDSVVFHLLYSPHINIVCIADTKKQTEKRATCPFKRKKTISKKQ